ncbi:MAG: hypothetical protein IME93_04035 [Proteobacteria bacterium]|nr:hypothetical protein [Pseudomonadota bacterium]
MYQALILHPKDPLWAPDTPTLLADSMHECGLIEREPGPNFRYEFGDEFTRLVTFLGCSPTLHEANSGNSLFHILLPIAFGKPQLIAGDAANPRCGHCKKAISGWSQHYENNKITCPHCSSVSDANSLHWRRQGSITRTAIIIEGVMEGIAVPADTLLSRLQSVSHRNWDYFYYTNSKSWPE